MKNKMIGIMRQAGMLALQIWVMAAVAMVPLVLTSCANQGGIGGVVSSAEAWWNDPANQAKIQQYVKEAETIAGFILPLLATDKNQASVSQKVQSKFVEKHPDIVIPAGALKKIAEEGTRRAIEKKNGAGP